MKVLDIKTNTEVDINQTIGLIKGLNKDGEIIVVYSTSIHTIYESEPNSFYSLLSLQGRDVNLPSLTAAAIKKLNLDPNCCQYTIFKQSVIDELGLTYSSNNTIIITANNRYNHRNYIQRKPIDNRLANNKQYLIGAYSPSNINFEKVKYTFGVEIETSESSITYGDLLLNNANVMSLRDGSVPDGHEFVTGVLTGDSGLNQLNNIVKTISRYSQIDKSCGVHVHVGGADFNKNFVVLAYILGLKIEDEILSLVPNSRKNNPYCGRFKDFPFDYEYPLKAIQNHGFEMGVALGFEFIYRQMSYDNTFDMSNYDKLATHRFGRYCGKYNDISNDYNFRYKWLNLIPSVFNMKSAVSLEQLKERATIEFRHHSATLNFNKIKNFILLCSAFVRYVENNREDILNKEHITVSDLLKEAYPKKHKILTSYFESRKTLFNTKDNAVEEKEYENEFNKRKAKKIKPEAPNFIINARPFIMADNEGVIDPENIILEADFWNANREDIDDEDRILVEFDDDDDNDNEAAEVNFQPIV